MKATIVSYTRRKQMIKAVIQLSKIPNQKLLTDITQNPIASKIKMLLKGLKAYLVHTCSSSKAASPFNNQNFNLNFYLSKFYFVGTEVAAAQLVAAIASEDMEAKTYSIEQLLVKVKSQSILVLSKFLNVTKPLS